MPKNKWHTYVLGHSIAVHMLDNDQTQENLKISWGHKDIRTMDVYGAISGRKQSADLRTHGTSQEHSEFNFEKVEMSTKMYPNFQIVAQVPNMKINLMIGGKQNR